MPLVTCVLFLLQDTPMEKSGEWTLVCTYKESRPELKEILGDVVVQSKKVSLTVEPGSMTFKIHLFSLVPQSCKVLIRLTEVKYELLSPYLTKMPKSIDRAPISFLGCKKS